MCKTGSAAGKCSGAKSNTVRRRSNHARTADQAGRQKRANTDAAGGWRVHTADDAPRRNAATRSKHLSFMCQGDTRPRAADDCAHGQHLDLMALSESRPLRIHLADRAMPLSESLNPPGSAGAAGQQAGGRAGPKHEQGSCCAGPWVRCCLRSRCTLSWSSLM